MSNVPLNPSDGDGLFMDSTTGNVRLIKDKKVIAEWSNITGEVEFPQTVTAKNMLYSGSIYDDYITSGTAVAMGPSSPDIKEFRDGLFLCTFAGTGPTTEQAFFPINMSHTIKVGNIPALAIHWSHNNPAPAGNVKWFVDFSVAEGYERGTFPAPTTVSVVQAAGAQYLHHVSHPGETSIGEVPPPDSAIICRIYRDPGDPEDTFEDDAFLIQVALHYVVGQSGTTERDTEFTSAGF